MAAPAIVGTAKAAPAKPAKVKGRAGSGIEARLSIRIDEWITDLASAGARVTASA